MNLRAFVERRYVGSLTALLAGSLFALSFAPVDIWPLAMLMPAVLIWLWQGAAPKRAAWLGFWFNAGTFAAGTYWLYISLKLIGGAPLPLALLLMIGLVAIMGFYHYLLGWSVAKYFPERGALRWMIAIPGAWLLIEWFRSWFLSGFGWLALGYSQTDTWLGNLAPVVGQWYANTVDGERFEPLDGQHNLLRPVWRDGQLLDDESLTQIRHRIVAGEAPH